MKIKCCEIWNLTWWCTEVCYKGPFWNFFILWFIYDRSQYHSTLLNEWKETVPLLEVAEIPLLVNIDWHLSIVFPEFLSLSYIITFLMFWNHNWTLPNIVLSNFLDFFALVLSSWSQTALFVFSHSSNFIPHVLMLCIHIGFESSSYYLNWFVTNLTDSLMYMFLVCICHLLLCSQAFPKGQL
jgi:hypothetical protein